MISRVNLRPKLFGSFAILLLVILAVVFGFFRANLAVREATSDIDHSRQVTENFTDVLWHVSQIQTSYRGYMMSGDTVMLSTFAVSSQQFDNAFDRLKDSVLLEPTQFGRIVSIEQDVRDWRNDILEPGLDLRKLRYGGAFTQEASVEYLQSNTGNEEFRTITQLINEGISYENEMVRSLEERVEDRQRLQTSLILSGGAVIGVLGVSLAWWLSRDIGGAVSTLGTQAHRIAGGDLQSRIGSTRRDEIGRAASAFDVMADRLERMAGDLQETADVAREREHRIQTIVDNVAEGLISFDENGTITSVNPAATKMFGISLGPVVGGRITEFLRLPETDQHLEVSDILPKPGATQPVLRPADGLRTDGTTFPIEIIVNEIPEDDTREYMSVIRDVSERRQSENRLRAQVRVAEAAESRANAVLDATSEAMVLISDDFHVLTYNQTFTEFFQVRPDFIGRGSEELLQAILRSIDDPDHLLELVGLGRLHPDIHVLDIVHQHWPVERHLEYSSSPVTSVHGERLGRLYSFRDITHQREVDRLKNEFVSLVSHELRTPLTSIKGYVDLLLDEEMGALTDEQREFLEVVGSNAQRLVTMVDELLDISRIEAGKIELNIEPVDALDVTRQVIGSLRPLIDGKHQTVTIDSRENMPKVNADADLLTQILLNLISNAIKYSSDGGTITASLGVDGGFMSISVRDSGVGISPDEIKQLFNRFYRVDNRATREVAGAGLGLAITRSLVELHGGAINVTSEPGNGSAFTFTLPLSDQPESSSLPARVLAAQDH